MKIKKVLYLKQLNCFVAKHINSSRYKTGK